MGDHSCDCKEHSVHVGYSTWLEYNKQNVTLNNKAAIRSYLSDKIEDLRKDLADKAGNNLELMEILGEKEWRI